MGSSTQSPLDPPNAVPTPRVLVVDSSPLFAEALARSLKHAGVAARAASTGELGDCSAVAVVLLDGDGAPRATAQAAAAVRLAAPGATLLLLLKATHPNPERAVKAAGASGLVHRQTPVAAAVLSVQRVLSGRPASVSSAPRRRVAPVDLQALTRREHQVLGLIATGRQNDAIAQALGISANTVRTHVQSIFAKLGVSSRLAAVSMLHQSDRLSPRADLHDLIEPDTA